MTNLLSPTSLLVSTPPQKDEVELEKFFERIPNTSLEQRRPFQTNVYSIVVDNLGGGDFYSIENAADYLSSSSTRKSAEIFVRRGTYYPSKSITLPSGTKLRGETEALTTIHFNSTARKIIIAGGTAYTTGTITVASGTAITGSGTLWLANVTAGQSLFIGTRWYTIAAVTSNTTLVLSEAYGDNVALPATYRILTAARDVDISELTIQSSTSSAIDVDDARNLKISNCTLPLNATGIDYNNVSEIAWDNVIVAASTSTGITMTNCGLGDLEGIASTGSVGHNWTLNNVKTIPFRTCAGNAATSSGDGFNVTTSVNCLYEVEVNANAGQGIEFVSGCDNNNISDCFVTSNTSDGIKLTASSNRNIIKDNQFISNGAYGLNIANANDNENLNHGNIYDANVSGTFSDSGTLTTSADNILS